MSDNSSQEEVKEEDVFSFEESMKILKNLSNKIEKEQEQWKKKAIPLEKKDIRGQEVYEVEQKQLLSLEKQYSILLGSAMRFVNPVLKNWRIDPLNNQEIDNLSKAILNISESKVKKTVQKIEKRFDSLAKLSKFIAFIAVLWEIGVPRYDQLKGSIETIKAKQAGMVKQK